MLTLLLLVNENNGNYTIKDWDLPQLNNNDDIKPKMLKAIESNDFNTLSRNFIIQATQSQRCFDSNKK